MHVILGTGPVGTAVATQLLEQGTDTLIVSRSGQTSIPNAAIQALDVTNTQELTALTRGADVIYNCLNPAHYHRWPTEWPPMARSILTAARENGAVLATAGNLYPYGNNQDTLTPETPERPAGRKGAVRASMWADARAAHERGEVQALEVRSADYLALSSSVLAPAARAALRGRRAFFLGNPDAAHSWAHTPDVARTLIAAAATTATYGRLVFTPPTSNRSIRQVLRDLAHEVDRPAPKMTRIPDAFLSIGGALNPLIRELQETSSERNARFVLDSSATTAQLGIEPTPWAEVIQGLVASSTRD